MKLKFALSILFVCTFSLAMAQVPTPHSTPAARQKAKLRMDYSAFRKEINGLKEFADEKKKIPALQKETKTTVRVVATIDSIETDDDSKVTALTGYITQVIGENSANAYEITFDRATRKITQVKRTNEAVEPEAAEVKDKPAPHKPATTKPGTKKKDDDEDEADDEKTPATKDKDDE